MRRGLVRFLAGAAALLALFAKVWLAATLFAPEGSFDTALGWGYGVAAPSP